MWSPHRPVRVRIRLCIARTVLLSFLCRYSETLPSSSLTIQCASQLLLAHWISRDSKSGAAAPILATMYCEVGSVITTVNRFNSSVEHINRASTARYRLAASLDVFI